MAPRLVLVPVLLLMLAGCWSTPSPSPSKPEAPTELSVDASVAQYRPDEGTRRLRAGVTNTGAEQIRVSAATIAWDGLAFPTVPVPDGTLAPGETAAFNIEYGAPRCAASPTGTPALVAVVDGRSRRLPLRVEDPQLLERLRERACARQRLAAAATVTLQIRERSTHVGGEEWLPGRVVLTHQPGSKVAVTVVDLGGSVLLDLRPRNGRGVFPVVLSASRASLALPVLLGSAHRCDPHARGNSSQTFLLSVYLRLGDGPVQRQIVVPGAADQARLLALIDRDCR